MKKLLLAILAVCIVGLYSCETEPLDSEALGVIEGKGKVKPKKEKDEEQDCEVDLTPDLPALVNACTTAKGVDANDIYFDLTINDTALAGDYGAWCIDVDLSLSGNECFDADVYSSYEDLPVGAFENPDNFDLVNWIINQNYIGETSPSGGMYTFGDVQWAIWELVDNQNCQACAFLGDEWSEEKGQEIVDAAIANGEGFEPGEGQLLAIILIPTNNRQPVFISIPVECGPEPECETAFARGNDGNTCFLDEGFSRWGWTIGPLSPDADESYDIYAGAGQCDISKGELVGTVDIVYADGEVTVTYNIDESYSVAETHTYAGNDMFPTKKGAPTVAPGQYSIQENLEGDIYVIAHAVVCVED
ncbi:hypothetical protein FVB32_15430 [Flagellimonas hymeniacidonis]|uniref:Uncharacterized protein n=1 Tax=Flagellimonas hymeniacidonis TaxID=2603628 RepID=A0A5C8V3P2_9FLAO|nr:hypothetical protein [Flagellimonas hymeniacidonis]TXN35951.1 hypothetical protein FVB32_15430 [Flagellimonas hymeniacidonis]